MTFTQRPVSTQHLTTGFTKIISVLRSVFSSFNTASTTDEHIHFYLSYHSESYLTMYYNAFLEAFVFGKDRQILKVLTRPSPSGMTQKTPLWLFLFEAKFGFL